MLKKLILRAAELAGLPLDKSWILNISFVGDSAMARYNQEFVGHEGTTDVITFCYLDDGEELLPGDVAVDLLIGVEVAWREGNERSDSSYAEELALYITHGFLHSVGEDDLEPVARVSMRRREAEVMEVLRKEFNLEEIFPNKQRGLG